MNAGWMLVEGKFAGTAFAVAPQTVVTAAHVVGGNPVESLEFSLQGFGETRVVAVEPDETLDVAVVHLASEVPASWTVGAAARQATWEVTAQPRPNDPELHGVIDAVSHRFAKKGKDEIRVLQLRVDTRVGSHKGYSGSPVISDGRVVGVLVEQLPMRRAALSQAGEASNVLYAVPMEDVVARFGLPVTLESAEGPQSTAVLSRFLMAAAPAAVVQLTVVSNEEAVASCSAFFATPTGHLIAPRQSVSSLLDGTASAVRVVIAPSVGSGHGTSSGPVERVYDPGGPWVIVQVRPPSNHYVPIVPSTPTRRSHSHSLRLYGVAAGGDRVSSAATHVLGEDGSSAGVLSGADRFRIRLPVASRIRPGGPVIDPATGAVVGVLLGHEDEHRLVAEAAPLEAGALASVVSELELDTARERWCAEAVEHVRATYPPFARILAQPQVPALPELHLSERRVYWRARQVLADRSAVYLHGAPGSGKSVLAAELTRLRTAAPDVFWHDFEPVGHRLMDDLLRRLALFLLWHRSAFAAVEACVTETFERDRSVAITSICHALADAPCILVFDNVQFVQRENRIEILELLAEVAQTAQLGPALMVLTSWDPPGRILNMQATPITGFAPEEVQEFLRLHEVVASSEMLDRLSDLAEDINCVEAFVRSPTWRAAVASDRPEASEPDELITHWHERFLADVSPAGRDVLLALAVLGASASREALEQTADIEAFASTIEDLRRSPPLVRRQGDRYTMHHNVALAIKAITDRRDVLRAHSRAASHYYESGNYVASCRHLLDAGHREPAMVRLYDWRETIIAQGAIEVAEQLADRCRDLYRRTTRHLPYQLHAILASCRGIRGDYRGAVQHWGRALAGETDDLSTAEFLVRRADCHRLLSDYESARRDYEQAASIASVDASDSYAQQLGRANLGLAKLSRLSSSYGAALRQYTEAHTAFELALDDLGVIEADFGLGEVLRLLEKWEEAGIAYARSLDESAQQANLERQAYAIWGLGEVERLAGDRQAALSHHRHGLDLCVRVGDTRSEGWALLGLAETWRAENDVTEALTAYESALAVFERTGSQAERAHAMLGLAETYRSTGLVRDDLYFGAAEIYETKGLRHSLLQCWRAMACAYRIGNGHGRAQEADRILQRARQLATELELVAEVRHLDPMLSDARATPFIPLNFP